jgi:pyrroloquinoline quinone (PQQ) biosynthesis protein C
MSYEFRRTGELMDVRSYPQWIQGIVEECQPDKQRVAEHELFQRMRQCALSRTAARHFFVGIWPVIDQFPQYMAQCLRKARYGRSAGDNKARRYLTRNIRVEQKHADYWMDWAAAHGVARDEVLHGARHPAVEALSHWCWHACDYAPLAVAMGATNYCIEGVTGEWAALICSSNMYERSFPDGIRTQAMRWLTVHAAYDDAHPWEALEIIAMLLGTHPNPDEISAVLEGIRTSYAYMQLSLDVCLSSHGLESGAAPMVEERAA